MTHASTPDAKKYGKNVNLQFVYLQIIESAVACKNGGSTKREVGTNHKARGIAEHRM